MRWISEDPWLAVGGLVVLAVVFLGLLKIRQEGRWLIAAAVTLGVAVLLVLVERAWVTEAERVEAVVYQLAAGVRRSDADATLALLSPDLVVAHGAAVLGGAGSGAGNPARSLIAARMKDTIFDFFNASDVRIQADTSGGATASATATAQLKVFMAGSIEEGGTRFNFATDGGGTEWSLHFRLENGQWRVDRIAAERLPRGWFIPGLSGPGS